MQVAERYCIYIDAIFQFFVTSQIVDQVSTTHSPKSFHDLPATPGPFRTFGENHGAQIWVRKSKLVLTSTEIWINCMVFYVSEIAIYMSLSASGSFNIQSYHVLLMLFFWHTFNQSVSSDIVGAQLPGLGFHEGLSKV